MKVSLPRADSPSTGHKGFAFCEYPSVETAQYAQALFSGTVRLFGRPVRFNYSPKGAAASRCFHPICRQGCGPHDSSIALASRCKCNNGYSLKLVGGIALLATCFSTIVELAWLHMTVFCSDVAAPRLGYPDQLGYSMRDLTMRLHQIQMCIGV